MDPFTIGALILSIAGAGTQYSSAMSAANRTAAANIAAKRNQMDYQERASRKAMDNADEYLTENRMEKQQQIQDRLEQEYSAPVIDAQTINAKAATTQGDVSGDYQAAKAASDANVEQLRKTFTRLMARTGSAKQLRQNEAYKLADTASEIGRIQNFSQGQAAVDQQAISEAANSGATGNFIGGLLGAIGQAGMMYGGGLGKAVKPGIALDDAARSYASGFGKDFSGGFIGNARGGLF